MLRQMVRRFAGVSAVLLFSSGAYAADAGIQLGPVSVTPSLGLTLNSTSNLYLEGDTADKTSDWVTAVSPGLKFALPVRHFLLEVQGRLDWISHLDHSAEDAVNWNVGSSVGADFPGGLSFMLQANYTDRYLTRTKEFGPGEDTAIGNASAKVSYKFLQAYRIDLFWKMNSYIYDQSATRERDENTYQAEFFWRFMPRISAVLESGWTTYKYDSNKVQDGEALSLNGGLTWDVGVRTAGFTKVGYQWKSYEVTNTARNTVDGSYFTIALGMNHRFSSRTTVDAEANRMSMESDFPQSPYYLRTGVSVGIEQRLGRRLSAKVTAKYGLDEYHGKTSFTNAYDQEAETDSGTRTDTSIGGGIRIGFEAARWLNLGLGLTIENRDSSFDTFDYTVTRLGIDIAAKF